MDNKKCQFHLELSLRCKTNTAIHATFMSITKSTKCLGSKPSPMWSFGNAIPLLRLIIIAPRRKPWHPLFNHTIIIIITTVVVVERNRISTDAPRKGTAVAMEHPLRQPRPPPPLIIIINNNNIITTTGIRFFLLIDARFSPS